jgi:hypothetical protein
MDLVELEPHPWCLCGCPTELFTISYRGMMTRLRQPAGSNWCVSLACLLTGRASSELRHPAYQLLDIANGLLYRKSISYLARLP